MPKILKIAVIIFSFFVFSYSLSSEENMKSCVYKEFICELDELVDFDISINNRVKEIDSDKKISIIYSILAEKNNIIAEFSGYIYPHNYDQRTYEPDFTYKLGYRNYNPNTISFTYSNYSGNRFDPDEGQRFTRFENGTLSLSYRVGTKNSLMKKLTSIDDRFDCDIAANWVPRYFDEGSNDTNARNKITSSLNCKYEILRRFFVEGAVIAYPVPDQRQSFDPDYTYGFGVDLVDRGTFAIEYQNYSANKWPGRKEVGAGKFNDGVISLTYHLPW